MTKVLALKELGQNAEAFKASSEIIWDSTSAENLVYLADYIKVAKALGADSELKQALEHLENALRKEASKNKYFRANEDYLFELATGYDNLGLLERATSWAKELQLKVPDAPLPKNQFYRGVAARILRQQDVALTALTRAQSLLPTSYWIKKVLTKLHSEHDRTGTADRK